MSNPETQKTIAIVLNLSESATGLTKAEYSFGVEFKQSPLKVIDDLYWGAWIEEVYDDNGEEVIDHNYGLVERPAIVLDLGYDQNTKPIRWFAYKYDRNGDGVPETPTDNLSRSQLLNLLQTDTTYAFISYEHTFEVDYGTFENFDPMEESTWPTYLDSDAKTYFDEFRTNYNIPTQGSLYQKQILPTIVGEEDGNNVYQKITPHYYAQVHLEHSNDADEWVIGPNGDSGESHVWSVDMGGEDNYQICTYYFEWHAE